MPKWNNTNMAIDDSDKKKADLEAKSWFRLLKVVFVVIYLGGVLFGVVIGYAFRPTQVTRYTVECITSGPSGRKGEFNPEDKGVYIYSTKISADDDFKIRAICHYGSLDNIPWQAFGYQKPNLSTWDSTQYRIVTNQQQKGELQDAVIAGFISIGLWITFMEILKRVFYYVVVGKWYK